MPRTNSGNAVVLSSLHGTATFPITFQSFRWRYNAIDAAMQVIGNAPDGLVKLCPLSLFGLAHSKKSSSISTISNFLFTLTPT
jgi:hypothetical protein